MMKMSYFEKFMIMFATVEPIATIPQIIQVWADHSTQGVSLLTWSFYTLTSFLWFAYGIHKKDKPLILSGALWMLSQSLVVVGLLVRQMRSLGLIAYLSFILPVGYMLIRWPGETTKTYSQNAARHKASIIYYGLVLAVFLILLSIFAFGWLIPTLQLSTLFSVAFGIGVAAELLAGLVPETTGWEKTTHIATSGVMYLATLIIVGMLFLHATVSAVQVICTAAFIVMAAVILAALLFKRLQRYALLLQTIHLACFFGALLAVTYLQ